MIDSPQVVSYRKVWLIGVGTVFGTLGVILVLMLASIMLQADPTLSFEENFKFLLLYAFIGAFFAVVICIVLTVPMLLLWKLIFDRLRAIGKKPNAAAMVTAGLLSFFGTIVTVVWWVWANEEALSTSILLIPVVPVLIAILLAKRVFADRNESGEK